MVIMASGFARGRVRTTTTTTTESCNMAAILQITGWQRDMQPWFTVYFFGIGYPCYIRMQRTANENAACLRRICERPDQPKIERLVNNDVRLILRWKLNVVGLWISVDQLHTSRLASPCWRDPTRSKQPSTVAIWLSVWTLSCHCPVKLST